MLFDQTCDEPRGFRFLNKRRQPRCRCRIFLRRTTGLLNRTELTIEDSRTRHTFNICNETRPETGQHFQLVSLENLKCLIETVGQNQLGLLDVILQPKPVGRPRCHGDPIAWLVDFADGLNWRACRHQVSCFDLAIGGRKIDLLGTLWLRADIADVTLVGIGIITQRSW